MEIPPDENPDQLPDAAQPAVHRVDVDGAYIHTEVRGSGPAVMIIGAADEDAEVYRGIAERLAGSNTVVTYDRRGTGRSDRTAWPSDSARHADDAAVLIASLELQNLVVLGTSAGGVVALRLAISHPDSLKAVLCFEPGIFSMAEGGQALLGRVEAAVNDHLTSEPGDWQGATDVLGREAVRSVDDRGSLFTPPAGKEWFLRRTARNAESLIRGDLALTKEHFTPRSVADCPVTLRFSYGSVSLPIFRAITTNLAALRSEQPDVLEGVGHNLFFHPDEATQYLRAWT